MKLKTLTAQAVSQKTVFVRVDYNVPLTVDHSGKVIIGDDRRLRESLETLKFLIKHRAKVIVCAHLGRPKGHDPKLSLHTIAEYMQKHLDIPMSFSKQTLGNIVKERIDDMVPGKVLLLENVRYYPEEQANDPEFSKELANLADVYVNDSFSTAHRAHASTEGITHHLPSFAGFALQREVETLSELMKKPKRPFVVVLGGAKISDKVGAVKHLAKIADTVLIGGAIANNFLKAEGLEIHKSYIEDNPVSSKQKNTNFVTFAKNLLRTFKNEKTLIDGYLPLAKIVYPIDVVAAPSIKEKRKTQLSVLPLTHDMQDTDNDLNLVYADIGPKTIRLYEEILKNAGTIFWNGPMGVWENTLFKRGTLRIATAMTGSKAKTVVGGGDTIAAIDHFKLEHDFSYISAAGGASLEFLSGETLPGLKPLIR